MRFLSGLFSRRPKLARTVVGGSQSFASGVWRVVLPMDWECRARKGNSVALETSDRAKSVYISTVVVKEKVVSPTEIAKQLIAVTRQGLANMDGFTWLDLEDKVIGTGDGAVALLEVYDKVRSYRVCTKAVVEKGVAVRASFHDRDCINLRASREYFGGPMESVAVIG